MYVNERQNIQQIKKTRDFPKSITTVTWLMTVTVLENIIILKPTIYIIIRSSLLFCVNFDVP